MTAAHQLSIDDALAGVSEPIAGETAATVGLVANDWRPSTDADWAKFQRTCRAVAEYFGDGVYVDPNRVRRALTDIFGSVTIEPRRLSAFWARATAKNGFMDNTSTWVSNDDHKGGNAGKPIRLRRLRGAA